MDKDIIERVARAMAIKHDLYWDEKSEQGDIDYLGKNDYREMAEVAIAEAIEAVLEKYDAETAQLPLGHASVQRGSSSYNWRRYVVAGIRALVT